MAPKMLIDATHPDETRVVVVSNNRVEEFDYETANKSQIKGNIYLAKVTRVEPSLQAAFVEYGGNRHGFLPFSEIHPDYYRIPIADREALLAEEAAERNGDDVPESAVDRAARQEVPEEPEDSDDGAAVENGETDSIVEQIPTETSVDTVGGDDLDEAARRRAQLMRRYKIQEVIKRRQVMLVQVTKEERGSKGAALTTYLSLAGRYCVLMPNTAKGGGISRKIANAADRKRLKSVVNEMDIPEGMAVIVRTAGSQRTKTEIRRDYEYLLRLWNDIRNKTLQSTAPLLIHEEANLIKRAIRDLYTRDMDAVIVEGAEGHKAAKAFMRMLMPSHAKKVELYSDDSIPLFHRYQVEEQLESMHSPQVQLKSGGSIVINQTEALVAIDVNSGKATRERHIEETALKTNLEAADEVARQLRLRDLAGLIVIDFIDMEEPRHNREVERRLKEAMKLDRARIQLGRISPFGLLELSRQRLRPSLFETVNEVCRTCSGTGFVRSSDSLSLTVLRALTDEAVKRGGGAIEVRAPVPVALYILNEKRQHLQALEERFNLSVAIRTADGLAGQDFQMERLSSEPVAGRSLQRDEAAAPEIEPAAETATAAEDTAEETLVAAGSDGARKRRGRRGGRKRRRDGEAIGPAGEAAEAMTSASDEAADEEETAASLADGEDEEKLRRRRRGRRGGRRRSRTRTEGQSQTTDSVSIDEAAADAAPDPAAAAEPSVVEIEAAETSGDAAGGAAAEVKAKPRRRSRRKEMAEPSEAPQATESVALSSTDQPRDDDAKSPEEPSEAVEAAGADSSTVKAAKPRRRSTARQSAASGADAGAVSEEPAPKSEEKPKRRARRKPKGDTPAQDETSAPDAAVTQPAAQGNGKQQETAEPPPAQGEGSQPAERGTALRPARRGWWTRLLE